MAGGKVEEAKEEEGRWLRNEKKIIGRKRKDEIEGKEQPEKVVRQNMKRRGGGERKRRAGGRRQSR